MYDRIYYYILFIFILSSLSVGAQLNCSLVGQLDYPDGLSSLWGYTDADGIEYALVGATTGLSIVSLEDPSLPQELFFFPGPVSAWREIKVWQHYAYVTNESGGGVFIADLANLPVSVDTISYTGTADNPLHTAHTLFIDENGILYLYGYNVIDGFHGAYMADVSDTPMMPEFISTFDDVYIHDGFIRNDTLWAAEIYDGRFEIFDIADKNNFISLGYASTSAFATHNCQPSADGNYLFTTDELFTGFISAFNISDPADIQPLDQIKHGDIMLTVPHNVHVVNNYLVASHYSEGVVIIDATRPETLVEVGNYDTSPAGPESFFEGAWEAYPYFNSELIIVSDIQEGLFVIAPEYKSAAYLDGVAYDEISLAPIPGATVQIVGTDNADITSLLGEFSLGVGISGTYDIKVSAAGCVNKVFESVAFTEGETNILSAPLDCGTVDVKNPVTSDGMAINYIAESNTLQLFFNTQVNSGDIYCCIYDVAGNMVQQIFANSANSTVTVPLNLASGFYVCAVQLENELWLKEFVVH